MQPGFLQLVPILPSQVFILQYVLSLLHLRVNAKIGEGPIKIRENTSRLPWLMSNVWGL